jgi:hypothetical protein
MGHDKGGLTLGIISCAPIDHMQSDEARFHGCFEQSARPSR